MRIFTIERFDQNEWFIIITIVITYLIAYMMPRRLPASISLLLMVWAITVSKLCDFTIGGGIFDYYDVNDSPRYCLMDLVSYFLYAPFAYFFIYLYEVFRVKARYVVLYIMVWSAFSLGIEWLMVIFKVITYKNGYHMYDSYIIYLFTQSLTILFYRWIKGNKAP